MKAKLTQELQQAKNMHNVLQAELDKVGPAPPLFLLIPRFPYTCYFYTTADRIYF